VEIESKKLKKREKQINRQEGENEQGIRQKTFKFINREC
jgi:hypothetical protein